MAFALLSALTAFVEATYIFGLLGTDIPPEIAFVLFLLSPFLLLILPRLVDNRVFRLAAGGLGLVCWVIGIPLGMRLHLLFSGLSCGLFLFYFAARIRQDRASLSAGIGGGALLSILFRTVRSGNLFLEDGCSLAACALLSAAAIALLVFSRADSAPEPETGTRARASLRSIGMSVGLFGALALLYFGFTSPVVMARWMGSEYPAVVVVEAGALVLFMGAWLCLPCFRAGLSPGVLAAWNLLFVAALAAALRIQQPWLGAGAGFPVFQREPGALGRTLFWIMLVLHPVIYADFALLARALHAERPSPRGLVRGFAVGSLFLLLLIFSQVFTTVYDYIPVIGPWFRDRFWLVMSVPGAVLTLSVLLIKSPSSEDTGTRRLAWTLGMAAAAVGAVLTAGLTAAHPAPAEEASRLRILTYNIQQGCGRTGEKSVRQQMELMRGLEPDIIGLQETDTARAAGGNSDIVRFLADGLGMYSYYGPSPVSGTFGEALLSRYPIAKAHTFFMPSRGEQTAAIEAEIVVGGKPFRVIVTHLDNDGALPQQRLIIGSAVGAMAVGATAVVMGDFNFDPSTEQYKETVAVLHDAWTAGAERTAEPGAPDLDRRIDHIFASPDIRVSIARYLPRGLSDHPAMFAEIEW